MGFLEDGIGAAVDRYACLHHSLQTLRTFWQRLDVLEERVLPCALVSAPAQSRGVGRVWLLPRPGGTAGRLPFQVHTAELGWPLKRRKRQTLRCTLRSRNASRPFPARHTSHTGAPARQTEAC